MRPPRNTGSGAYNCSVSRSASNASPWPAIPFSCANSRSRASCSKGSTSPVKGNPAGVPAGKAVPSPPMRRSNSHAQPGAGQPGRQVIIGLGEQRRGHAGEQFRWPSAPRGCQRGQGRAGSARCREFSCPCRRTGAEWRRRPGLPGRVPCGAGQRRPPRRSRPCVTSARR